MYKIIGADGKEYGPVTAEQLKQWITEGRVNAQTRVQLEGSPEWKTLSQLPEFSPAVGAATPPMPVPVPVSVKVFAVLNMVFGGVGLLCSPFSFIGIPATMRILGDSGLVRGWLLFSAAWSVIGAVILLASGIGLWRLKAWARKLAVYYSCLAILLGLVGMVVVVSAFAGNASAGGPERIGGMVGGVVGGFFGLAYNVLLIIFLSRRPAREAFQETLAA
jgi:hypothetical protein